MNMALELNSKIRRRTQHYADFTTLGSAQCIAPWLKYQSNLKVRRSVKKKNWYLLSACCLVSVLPTHSWVPRCGQLPSAHTPSHVYLLPSWRTKVDPSMTLSFKFHLLPGRRHFKFGVPLNVFEAGSTVHRDRHWKFKYKIKTQKKFGGLVFSMLASGTRVRGFEPGRSRWIFRVSE